MVIGLADDRPIHAHRIAKLADFRDAPGTIVRHPEIADLALPDDVGEKVLNRHAMALAASMVEINENHCDGMGFTAPVQEAVIDAQEWRDWVLAVRGKL